MRTLLVAVFTAAASLGLAACASSPGGSPFDAQVCPGADVATVGPCGCAAGSVLECLGSAPPLCGCVPADAGGADAAHE